MTRNRNRPAPLPRLKSGPRAPGFASLLPEVKVGIDAIARGQGWSRSRVMAYLICDWFDLDAATGLPIPGRRKNSRRYREAFGVD